MHLTTTTVELFTDANMYRDKTCQSSANDEHRCYWIIMTMHDLESQWLIFSKQTTTGRDIYIGTSKRMQGRLPYCYVFFLTRTRWPNFHKNRTEHSPALFSTQSRAARKLSLDSSSLHIHYWTPWLYCHIPILLEDLLLRTCSTCFG
jgi:hypothetical protein